ncbi:MAG: thioesterase family protein, partial [Candidatus Nanopelagicales bacterium]
LEPLTIEVWISAVGRTSYHLNYRIINEQGVLNAEAESVMVCFDNDKAVPIPPKMREALLAVAELE